jgi:exosortase/archaeosortase family protein
MKKKKKEGDKKYLNILSRYIILAVLGFSNLIIFYKIFYPLTIYPVNFLFNLIFDSSVIGNTILILNNGCFPIEIVEACVAASAYYLLLIFNMSVPETKVKKRILMVFFAIFTLLAVNILRIFFLGLLYVLQSPLFNVIHTLMWFALSGLLISFICFA